MVVDEDASRPPEPGGWSDLGSSIDEFVGTGWLVDYDGSTNSIAEAYALATHNYLVAIRQSIDAGHTISSNAARPVQRTIDSLKERIDFSGIEAEDLSDSVGRFAHQARALWDLLSGGDENHMVTRANAAMQEARQLQRELNAQEEVVESVGAYSTEMTARHKSELASAGRWLAATVALLFVVGGIAVWVAFDTTGDTEDSIGRSLLAFSAASVATWTGRQYSSHRKLDVAYRDAALRMETLAGITRGLQTDDREMFDAVLAKMLEAPIGAVTDQAGPGFVEYIHRLPN